MAGSATKKTGVPTLIRTTALPTLHIFTGPDHHNQQLHSILARCNPRVTTVSRVQVPCPPAPPQFPSISDVEIAAPRQYEASLQTV